MRLDHGLCFRLKTANPSTTTRCDSPLDACAVFNLSQSRPSRRPHQPSFSRAREEIMQALTLGASIKKIHFHGAQRSRPDAVRPPVPRPLLLLRCHDGRDLFPPFFFLRLLAKWETVADRKGSIRRAGSRPSPPLARLCSSCANALLITSSRTIVLASGCGRCGERSSSSEATVTVALAQPCF